MYDALNQVQEVYGIARTSEPLNVAGEPNPTANHRESPFVELNLVPAAVVPKPPDPAYGGQSNLGKWLGWSTGIRNSRAFRQPLSGLILTLSNRGANPNVGPVGYSNRTGRLAAGVANLAGDGSADSQSSNAAVLGYDGISGGNPNYA